MVYIKTHQRYEAYDLVRKTHQWNSNVTEGRPNKRRI